MHRPREIIAALARDVRAAAQLRRVSRRRTPSSEPPPSRSTSIAVIVPWSGPPASFVSAASTSTIPPGATRPETTFASTRGMSGGSTSTSVCAVRDASRGSGATTERSYTPSSPVGTVSVPPRAPSSIHVDREASIDPRPIVALHDFACVSRETIFTPSVSPARTTRLSGTTIAYASRSIETHVTNASGCDASASIAAAARTRTVAATPPAHGPDSRSAPSVSGARHVISASPCAFVVTRMRSPSPSTSNGPLTGCPSPSATLRWSRCSMPGTTRSASGTIHTLAADTEMGTNASCSIFRPSSSPRATT